MISRVKLVFRLTYLLCAMSDWAKVLSKVRKDVLMGGEKLEECWKRFSFFSFLGSRIKNLGQTDLS